MRASVVVLAIVLLGGCKDFFAPMPGDPVLSQPDTAWAAWYRQVESCTGKGGNFARVRWYKYSGDRINMPLWISDKGAQTFLDHKIAIAAAYWEYKPVVAHEMIHEITHVSGHPASLFGMNGRCADVLLLHGPMH